jgi:hypothetical protein
LSGSIEASAEWRREDYANAWFGRPGESAKVSYEQRR